MDGEDSISYTDSGYRFSFFRSPPLLVEHEEAWDAALMRVRIAYSAASGKGSVSVPSWPSTRGIVCPLALRPIVASLSQIHGQPNVTGL